jgi:hypothetical protein
MRNAVRGGIFVVRCLRLILACAAGESAQTETLGKLALLAKEDLMQTRKERAAAQTKLDTARAEAKQELKGKAKTAAAAAVTQAEADLDEAKEREREAVEADKKAQAALDKAQSGGGSGSGGILIICVRRL